MYFKNKIFLFLIFIVLIIFVSSSCAYKGIEENDYVKLEYENFFYKLQKLANNLDEIYTLYLIDSISDEDFLNELSLLKYQNEILDIEYNKFKEENSIMPNTNSYLSDNANESMKNIRNTIKNIIINSVDENNNVKSKEDILNLFKQNKENLVNYLSEYMTSYELIIIAENIEE